MKLKAICRLCNQGWPARSRAYHSIAWIPQARDADSAVAASGRQNSVRRCCSEAKSDADDESSITARQVVALSAFVLLVSCKYALYYKYYGQSFNRNSVDGSCHTGNDESVK